MTEQQIDNLNERIDRVEQMHLMEIILAEQEALEELYDQQNQ